MHQRHNRKAGLGSGMQPLEDRRLMAGDVDVALNFGDLYITGDGGYNRVDITEFDGQIEVRGTNWYGQTTINDGGQPYTVNANLVDDLRIDMNGGSDRVFINGVHLNSTSHADIYIDTDGGNDLVGVYNSSARDLDIESGSGHDDVIVSYSAFGRDMEFDLGSGNDELDLYAAYAGDDIEIFGQSGHDDVALQGVTVVDDFYARLGSGNDVMWTNGGKFRDVAVYGEDGADRVTFQGASIQNTLFVDMGAHDDQLYLYNNTVNGWKTFRGGTGNDTLGGSGNNFNPWAYDSSF